MNMDQLNKIWEEIPNLKEYPVYETGGVDDTTFIILLIFCFPLAILYACCAAGSKETHNVEHNFKVREHNRKYLSYNSYCSIQKDCYIELKEKMWMFEHSLIPESEIDFLINQYNYWGNAAKEEWNKIHNQLKDKEIGYESTIDDIKI